MKRKNLTALVAKILALTILVGSVFTGLSACSSAERIDVLRLTTTEELLFSEDFSGTAAGALPDGWDKTYPYTFLEDADKSTSLQTEGGNKSHVSVRKKDDRSSLGFFGRDGANIITLPESFEGNWVLSFDLNFKSFMTPFGVAVDLADNPEEATGATLFTLSGEEKKSGDTTVYKPIFSLYNRVNGGGDFVGKDKNRTDLAVADLLPELIAGGDKKSGTGTISSDTVMTIKVYRYEGVYYFFCNDRFVADIDDAGRGNRVGFFSDVEGREAKVSNVLIYALGFAPEVANQTYNIGTIFENNFANAENDAGGWKFIGDYSGEGSDGTFKEEGGKAIIDSQRTSVYKSPVFESKNFCLTAEITPTTEELSFGVLTGINAAISNNKNGFAAMVDMANGKLQSVSLPDKDDLTEFDTKETLGKLVKAGEACKLTVYVFENNLYLFVNDEFAFCTKTPGTNRKQYCGIVVSGGSAEVSSVKVETLVRRGEAEGFTLERPTIAVSGGKAEISLVGKMSANDLLLAYANGAASAEFGFLLAEGEKLEATAETEGATLLLATVDDSDKAQTRFNLTCDPITKETAGKSYMVRGYIAVKNGDEKVYFYSKATALNPAGLASDIYINLTEQADKDMLDTLFEGVENYIGKYEKSITFGLFSDFHYKFGMYSTSVADMEAIFKRASEAGASFVLSGGDMCNDFRGSPEITNAFLNNKYNLPAYNVYGNHELEAGNTMQEVTPLITNDKNVVWGTKDGKIGNGSIAYYYADRAGVRIVCVDTNYSYDKESKSWEHNETGSYGPPEGNTQTNSLGPVQREWLEEVLTDAANKSIPCIVIGHATMSSNIGGAAGDAAEVREIYNRVNAIRKGTVLLSINGHYHTNRMFESEGILYIDMNTTRNGVWRGTGEAHYGANHTFEQIEYDDNGNPVTTRKVSLNTLTMGKNTWFFEDPLSAVVTVSQYGTITVEGMESRWIYGVNPDAGDFEEPRVSSGKWELIK